jgi:anti-anti-sigma factor
MSLLPSATLSPKVEQRGDIKIITLTGEDSRDMESGIARELEPHLANLTGCHLLLDFTNIERITSVELGTLIQLHKRLAAGGGRLTLFNLRTEVYEVFTATRLHTVLGICR